jgi:YD repeat-containing protein
MFSSRIKRPFRICLPLAAIAVLVLPAASQAESSGRCEGTGVPCFVERGTGPHVTFEFDSGPNPAGPKTKEIPCLTSDEGTVTATGDETGRGNFNPDAVWVHFHSTYVETGRVDFPSGIYVLYSFTARGGSQLADNRTTVTFTDEGSVQGTVYDADGNPTGQTIAMHAIKHYTFIDSGDVGVPFDSDPTDTFLADVDRTRWTCS